MSSLLAAPRSPVAALVRGGLAGARAPSSRAAPRSAALSRRELLGGAAAAAGAAASAAGAPPAAVAAASASASAASTSEAAAPPLGAAAPAAPTERDAAGVERLALRPEGWNSWAWEYEGQRINTNWLRAGDAGPAVVLVHGFGASAYHFRYTVPALAAGGCRVFALDVCGFGWTDKPDISYENYDVWRQQLTDFIEQVVGPGERVVLAGNSLGGFNTLNAAAARPDLVSGVVLLNAAGRFDPAGADGAPAPAAEVAAAEAAAAGAPAGFSLATLKTSVTTAVKRAVIAATFLWTKQPARVRQVLRQVYVSETHIDDDLVRSILLPADHPNAAETFYRVITANGTPVNRLLARMAAAEVPLLLLWGARDPWCTPARADQIEGAYPAALTERVNVEAGHCPFDDVPELVSPELLRWARARAAQAAALPVDRQPKF